MNPGRWILLAAALVSSASAVAMDNPDAPARIAQFLAKAKPYEQTLASQSSQPRFGKAADAYSRFLDSELNHAYSALSRRLDAKGRHALMNAQRDWLAYRNAESSFIDTNWDRSHFGDSSRISRADYRAALVKQRVLTLLEYLQNYAD